MITIKMTHDVFKLEFKANSTLSGFQTAKDKYKKLGLTGKCFVTSSEGSYIII